MNSTKKQLFKGLRQRPTYTEVAAVATRDEKVKLPSRQYKNIMESPEFNQLQGVPAMEAIEEQEVRVIQEKQKENIIREKAMKTPNKGIVEAKLDAPKPPQTFNIADSEPDMLVDEDKHTKSISAHRNNLEQKHQRLADIARDIHVKQQTMPVQVMQQSPASSSSLAIPMVTQSEVIRKKREKSPSPIEDKKTKIENKEAVVVEVKRELEGRGRGRPIINKKNSKMRKKSRGKSNKVEEESDNIEVDKEEEEPQPMITSIKMKRSDSADSEKRKRGRKSKNKALAAIEGGTGGSGETADAPKPKKEEREKSVPKKEEKEKSVPKKEEKEKSVPKSEGVNRQNPEHKIPYDNHNTQSHWAKKPMGHIKEQLQLRGVRFNNDDFKTVHYNDRGKVIKEKSNAVKTKPAMKKDDLIAKVMELVKAGKWIL